MMKKHIAFLVVVVMLLLVACHQEPENGLEDTSATTLPTSQTQETTEDLSDAERQAITDSWNEQKQGKFGTWYRQPNENGVYGTYRVRYYGKCSGYIILFRRPVGYLEIPETKMIAGVEFYDTKPFQLWAYRDSKFISLEDAYEEGIFSDEDISLIADWNKQKEGN